MLASDATDLRLGLSFGVCRLRTHFRVAGVAVSQVIEVLATGSLDSSGVCGLECGRE